MAVGLILGCYGPEQNSPVRPCLHTKQYDMISQVVGNDLINKFLIMMLYIQFSNCFSELQKRMISYRFSSYLPILMTNNRYSRNLLYRTQEQRKPHSNECDLWLPDIFSLIVYIGYNRFCQWRIIVTGPFKSIRAKFLYCQSS